MVQAPCPGFAAAYQKALDGMVEKRMRAAIHAVASAWFTAWVDAGQPDLDAGFLPAAIGETTEESLSVQQAFESATPYGRPEGDQ